MRKQIQICRYKRTYFNKNKIPSGQPKNKSNYKVVIIKWR